MESPDPTTPSRDSATVPGTPRFFFSAAEHSGDALGAALITALRRRVPEASFTGVGGAQMARAGCTLIAEPVKRSAMLAGAYLTNSVYWWKLLRTIEQRMARDRFDVVVPIDSSAVNLRVAARARKLGLPVCYYVAPQVWASRPWRVKKIAQCVDTLCCILPFEEAYFKARQVHAVYVGHPMFDVPVETAAGELTLPAGVPRVAVFPGSRKAEVDAHMPAMLEILSEIKGRFPKVSFVAAAPSEERAWQIRHNLRTANIPVDIRVGNADAIIQWADLVLCKSGTATLQVARQGKAMVVIFAVKRWQWAVVKHLILTNHIALVNILAGREVAPEFIPFYVRASVLPVARKCVELLGSSGKRAAMEEELRQVVAPLWPDAHGGLAADRVAAEVLALVK